MIKYQIQKITPEEAKEILKNHNSKNYRKRKPNVINLYTKEITEGRWMFNGDTIRFDSNGELIDGQNRLEAIVKSNIPLEFIVVEGLDPECSQTIDIGYKRSAEDYLKKFASMYENGATAVVKLAMTLRRGNKQIGHSTANAGISNTMMVDEYMDNATQYVDATNFGKDISKLSRKVLKPSQVGGIYYYLVYTEHYDKDLVSQFFYKLASYSTTEITYMTKAYEALRDGKFGRSGVDIINVYKDTWNRWANSGKKVDKDWFIAPTKSVAKKPSKEYVETPIMAE